MGGKPERVPAGRYAVTSRPQVVEFVDKAAGGLTVLFLDFPRGQDRQIDDFTLHFRRFTAGFLSFTKSCRCGAARGFYVVMLSWPSAFGFFWIFVIWHFGVS